MRCFGLRSFGGPTMTTPSGAGLCVDMRETHVRSRLCVAGVLSALFAEAYPHLL